MPRVTHWVEACAGGSSGRPVEQDGGVDGGVVSGEGGSGISAGARGVHVAVSGVHNVGESTTVSSSPSNSTLGESDGADGSSGGKQMFCLMDTCRDSGQ